MREELHDNCQSDRTNKRCGEILANVSIGSKAPTISPNLRTIESANKCGPNFFLHNSRHKKQQQKNTIHLSPSPYSFSKIQLFIGQHDKNWNAQQLKPLDKMAPTNPSDRCFPSKKRPPRGKNPLLPLHSLREH